MKDIIFSLFYFLKKSTESNFKQKIVNYFILKFVPSSFNGLLDLSHHPVHQPVGDVILEDPVGGHSKTPEHNEAPIIPVHVGQD